MNYTRISNFGSNAVSELNNPLTYCLNTDLDNQFLHGSSSVTLSSHSLPCQRFMSEYCSQKWDNYCEAASQNAFTDWKNPNYFPNNMVNCLGDSVKNSGPGLSYSLSQGDMLVRNTASRKYLINMIGADKVYELFDPNVPSSPMISYWIPNGNGGCSDGGCGGNQGTPVYSVDPSTIENDMVMHKLLNNPKIAPDILTNMYNTMKRMNTLPQLSGTRLGNFYTVVPYFATLGGLK